MTWTRQQRHKAKPRYGWGIGSSDEVEQAIKDELARPDTNHQRILHLAYNAWSAPVDDPIGMPRYYAPLSARSTSP
jgi:hypothetical protein